jgi:hypothetical protein
MVNTGEAGLVAGRFPARVVFMMSLWGDLGVLACQAAAGRAVCNTCGVPELGHQS